MDLRCMFSQQSLGNVIDSNIFSLKKRDNVYHQYGPQCTYSDEKRIKKLPANTCRPFV